MNKYDKLWPKQGIKYLNIKYNKDIFFTKYLQSNYKNKYQTK